MVLPLSPQTFEALVDVISGGPGAEDGVAPPIGIYRSGSRIVSFMRGCGVHMEQPGSRVPALREALDTVRAGGDLAVLTRIIENAANPADFNDAEHHRRVVDHLNARLIADRMRLEIFDGRVRLVAINRSAAITSHLAQRVTAFDFDTVKRDLDRALDSAERDPEDAVTAASSILESMCRSILIEMDCGLPEKKDLASLYKAVREPLRLSTDRNDLPAEISNDVRGILSALTSVVQNVGALRTHAGDAHGRERGFKRIDGRIARLAIHSASAAALFLLETWEKRAGRSLPLR